MTSSQIQDGGLILCRQAIYLSEKWSDYDESWYTESDDDYNKTRRLSRPQVHYRSCTDWHMGVAGGGVGPEAPIVKSKQFFQLISRPY